MNVVHFLILLFLLMLLILAPQWWVNHVLARYNQKQEAFPGTGGELARHLLDRFGLQQVKVEDAGGRGDHYDPGERTVRLTTDKLEGRTLTAITTACHEVGHAMQHASGYGPFRWRQRLVSVAQVSEKIGSFLLFSVPLLTVVTRTPAAGLLMFLAAIGTLGMSVIVQLVTLPVELNASFARAMPILESGYIDASQRAGARRILRACAFTYLASSLAGLLNFWRWRRLLRP